MKPNSSKSKSPAEQVVKVIRRKNRQHFPAEDKIRMVLEGLRGDDSIAELCREARIEAFVEHGAASRTAWSNPLQQAPSPEPQALPPDPPPMSAHSR